jgi:hypothetical protein
MKINESDRNMNKSLYKINKIEKSKVCIYTHTGIHESSTNCDSHLNYKKE